MTENRHGERFARVEAARERYFGLMRTMSRAQARGDERQAEQAWQALEPAEAALSRAFRAVAAEVLR